MLLIIFNIKAIKKEDRSFDGILKDKYDNMEEIDLKLGKLRKEFTENIFELQQEIEELKGSKNNIEFDSNVFEINYDNDKSNNNKINEIDKLLKQGNDIDEIANKLNIGKGEVLLIQELYLK